MAAFDGKKSDLNTYLLNREGLGDLAAGGGTSEVVRFLATTQYSRRLLLLRLLTDAAEPIHPLPPVDQAWQCLERAQELDLATFRTAVMYPQIGNWASYVVRRLFGGGDRLGRDDREAPLWVDLGQFHAVALVVAYRCGLEWRTEVPMRDGRVTLPGLGQAYFESQEPWGVAAAWVAEGRIRLEHGGVRVAVPVDPAEDATGWWGLRYLAVGHDPDLYIALDDVDPFRNLADPVKPERLTAGEVRHWRSQLEQAWGLLSDDDPESADAIAAGVLSLAPFLRADDSDDEGSTSASTADGFGAIILSKAPDPPDLAVTVVHEFQHIKLGCVMHLLQLHHPGIGGNLYAPWRDDPRPLGGLLQGVYAFQGIARFWRRRSRALSGPHQRSAQFAYALARTQTAEGLAEARRSGGLTRVGSEFMDGVADAMEPWFGDDLPADIMRLVGLATMAHRVRWRIDHRRLARGVVATAADAWSRGGPADWQSLEDFTVEAPQDPPGQSMIWLRPIRRAVNSTPDLTSPIGALLVGFAAQAKAGFLARIAARPSDTAAWAGLAMAAAELGEVATADVLAGRPDVVYALYRAFPSTSDRPEPDRLAAWVAQGSAAPARGIA